MAAFIDSFRRACGSATLAALIAVNVFVFVAVWIAVAAGNRMGIPGNFSMQWLCVASAPESSLTRPWTVLTYMVTHYSFLHLLFNMLWLFWFGRILQTVLTGRHLLWLYIGGGLAGALLFIGVQAMASPASSAYLCGASASVLAVMTAAAIRTPDLRLYLFLFGEVKLKWIAAGCIALTFLGVGGGNPGGQAAHVGGVVFGAIFAFLLKRGVDVSARIRLKVPRPRKPRPRDAEALARAAAGRLSDTSRLDALLDKIRLSGYSSLTQAERRELNALSRKLNDSPRPKSDN